MQIMVNKNTTIRDIVLIVFLFLISFIAVYVTPNIVRTVILTAIAYFFIKSKDVVPWIIFFFLYISAPATLFYTGSERWFFFLTSKVGLDFSVLVSFAFLIKGYMHRRNIKNRFSIEQKLYFFYIPLLFFIGFFYGGIDFTNAYTFLKVIPNFFLFLFLPVIVDMRKDYDRIKKLLYVFTIFLFIIQLYEVILGKSLFGAGKLYITDELQRNISGIFFVFFTMIIAMADLMSRSNKTNLLVPVTVFVSILMMVNSGTRGWMIASAFIVVSILIFGNKLKTVLISFLSVALVAAFLFLAPSKYIDNISGSITRFATIFSVLEGNESAGGPRLTRRLPRVMNEFWKSPVFGIGVSDKNAEYFDGHVANASILLQTGIVGFTLLYIILIRILWVVFKGYLSLRMNNIYRIYVLAMIIGYLGIMLIHFTSRQMYSYRMPGDSAMLFAFWFLFTFYYLDKAKEYDQT